jgi:RNA polymerase sigma-70 factor (ECF subfamily)
VVENAGMPESDTHDAELVRLLTSYQRDIYFYVRSLILDLNDVEEIVQNTNLLLWEKRDQFDISKDFRPWAFQIARYKVLEYRAQCKRKCVHFSDALIDELAIKSPQYSERVDADLMADLRRCIAQLAARDRDILNQRYSSRATCESVAKAIGRPIHWVYKALNRIRQELADCMAKHANTRRER